MQQRPNGVFHVGDEERSLTLAAALRGWLGLAWSQVQKLVRQRYVMIDGNLCSDAARRLKKGEVVKVLVQPAQAPPSLAEVQVCYWDRHLVVVDKPPGITSVRHQSERSWSKERRQHQPTLEDQVNQLLAQLEGGRRDARKESKSKNSHSGGSLRLPPVRPVHRIDRETSGLLVFARTRQAETALAQQFRSHTTHRRYLAVAVGQVPIIRLESRLVRDRGDGRRGSVADRTKGKQAITHVAPVLKAPGYTLLECRLETGRTHQIRIHLSERGNPICGDRVYRQPFGGPVIADESQAVRLALHAAELGFLHPITGELLKFQSALPDDLLKLVARLFQQSAEQVSSQLRTHRSQFPAEPVTSLSESVESEIDDDEDEELEDAPAQRSASRPQRPQRFASQPKGERPFASQPRGPRSAAASGGQITDRPRRKPSGARHPLAIQRESEKAAESNARSKDRVGPRPIKGQEKPLAADSRSETSRPPAGRTPRAGKSGSRTAGPPRAGDSRTARGEMRTGKPGARRPGPAAERSSASRPETAGQGSRPPRAARKAKRKPAGKRPPGRGRR